MKCVRKKGYAGIWRSLPSRERGLKSVNAEEIGNACYLSLPSRERGLKYRLTEVCNQGTSVAPLAGAWIEIQTATGVEAEQQRRSPRGSVD